MSNTLPAAAFERQPLDVLAVPDEASDVFDPCLIMTAARIGKVTAIGIKMSIFLMALRSCCACSDLALSATGGVARETGAVAPGIPRRPNWTGGRVVIAVAIRHVVGRLPHSGGFFLLGNGSVAWLSACFRDPYN
jgi:hypothetical protein